MDWMRRIDGYCERTDPSYWAEPVNAVSNLAFVLAALVMWRLCAGLPAGRVLAAILFAIGVGSFLLHTHATVWAAAADVGLIAAFILTYLFIFNRDVLGLQRWSAGLAAALFLPFSAGMALALDGLPFFGTSAGYWPVALLILAYALGLWRVAPRTARGLLLGALILALSITLRSLDEPLCPDWPMGTHPAWHLLNAVMLAWMIEVYRRFRARVFAE